MEKEQTAVYLNDTTILHWDKNKSRLLWELGPLLDGRTTINHCLGIDVVHTVVAPYHIHASAVKYDAHIIPCDYGYAIKGGETFSHEEKHQILFDGTITLYEEGTIPETEQQGYSFLCSENIWTARDPLKIFQGEQGLMYLLFEGNPTAAKEQVDAIRKGYALQAQEQVEAQRRHTHESYMHGERDGRHAGPRGGSGPC